MAKENTNSERCFELEITKEFNLSVKPIKEREWIDEFYFSGRTGVLGTHCLESELTEKKKEVVDKAFEKLSIVFKEVSSIITKLINIINNGYRSIND